jgi:predicted RNase H-like nuclease
MDKNVTIIGIDCATDPAKMGLALGIWRNQAAAILKVKAGDRREPPARTVVDWISDVNPTLVAMDAPLGWPADLGQMLAKHTAGNRLGIPPNVLFRRKTDQLVKAELGRQPLDVGADRIARTAHAALQLLDELRTITGFTIPLAWHPAVEGVSAIEVYPAATLTAHGIQASGYKKKSDEKSRMKIIVNLQRHLELPRDTSLLRDNADVLDAGVCVLAAADFLGDRTVKPTDMATSQKEGWIWFCRREQS